jgi:5-methylcytosine-specific restriction endonuclease McrA
MPKLSILAPQVATLAPVVGYAPNDQVARRAYRKTTDPCQSWYTSRKWRALRWQVLTEQLFTCQWPGCGRVVVPASQAVCDHIRPHRGDPRLFWDRSNLQCLCKKHHDSAKQREERMQP